MKKRLFSGPRGARRKYLLILCAACLAVNVLGAEIAARLNLPVYLDVIGTTLAAALGGLIPGILVGFLTNLIKSFASYENLYYGSLSVLIAIFASIFAGRDYFRKPKKWPVVIITFTLIGGALGSVLTWFLYDFSFGQVSQSAPLARWILSSGRMNEFWAEFTADMLVDLLDKTVTVLAVALVMYLLPQKLKERLYYSGWHQKPLSARKLAKENHVRFHKSLRFKVILVVALATLITGMALTTISFVHFREAQVTSQKELARGTVNVVAGSFNPEHVDGYIQNFNGNEDAEYRDEYTKAEAIMKSLMDSSDYIEYCYVYKITPDGCVVAFDPDLTESYAYADDLMRQADASGDETKKQDLLQEAQKVFKDLEGFRDSRERAADLAAMTGTEPAEAETDDSGDGTNTSETAANGPYIEPFDKDFEDKVPDMLEGKEIEPRNIRSGKYGWLMTFYEPVYDDNGVCRCYAGVDISLDHIAKVGHQFLARVISLFFGFFVIILAVAIWLAEYNVILPINSMAMEANRFSFDTEESRKKAIDDIERLDIHTNDEIQNLYTAMIRTTKEMAMTTDSMARAIAQTQKQSALIGKMQNGLILVLADMVESRDQNTGEHVRKTAAYTGVIMRELRREHIYEDQLTDEFIQDVINSAPLHDVGKIQVPDQILNKPGKLDDEEFATMKTHTTAGAEIIASAMDMVAEENSGYLKEAMNLAHYHHEKWNGTGYPKGLKGVEIPLSARIMAVADVFDALVSKRSYKDGFPFEKAMGIIEEGIGTHFDPNVAGAFIRAKEEVREIMNSQMMGRELVMQETKG